MADHRALVCCILSLGVLFFGSEVRGLEARARIGAASAAESLYRDGGTARARASEQGDNAGAPSSGQQGQVEERVLVRARPLESIAASVTVIDEESIAAANVHSVAELLEYVAGARLLSAGSRGGLTTVQLRGGDPNFVLVLLDGVPLNDPTDVEGGTVNVASLPISSVERIEVARGPLSYFYGSTALSGIVNVVTRRGTTDRPQVRASLEGGGGSLLRADASISGLAGAGDYHVGVDWEQQRGVVGDDDFRGANLQGSFGLPLGEAGAVRLTARATGWEADDYPESSGGPELGTGELRHGEHVEVDVGADVRWDAGERWRNRLTVVYYRHDMDRHSPGVPPLVPPSVEDTSFTRLRAGWLATYLLTGGDGPAEGPVDRPTDGSRGRSLDSPSLRLSGGADVDHEDGTNASTLFLPPFFGGDVSGDYALSRTTPGTFVEISSRAGSLGVEAGVRADFPDEGDTEWSPRLGARYELDGPGTALRGTVSRAFKLPSFFALASPPALGGNPELLPEGSVGIDLGVDQRIDSWDTTASLTFFWIRYENLIDFDFDTFSHVNRAEVRSRGVELSLRWSPAPRLRVLSDITYQKAEDPDSEQPLRNLPEWTGSVRLAFQPLDPLQLRIEAGFASESFDVQVAVPDRDTVDGYGVLDLAGTWRLTPDWHLIGRVDNLTDTDYEHFIGFPQPGITAHAGIRYTLR